jgi:hypothetical protein
MSFFDIEVNITDKDSGRFIRPRATRGNKAYVDRIFREFVEDILDEGVKRAKRFAPTRTTRLRTSIERSRVYHRGREFGGSVGSDLYYAKWVEEGTGRYGTYKRDYGPRTQPFMIFRHEIGRFRGQLRKHKTIKGQKPQRFLYKSARSLNTGYIQRKLIILKAELAGRIVE